MTEKKNPAEKKKRGRKSEYRIEYADQALKLCLLGATDKELSEFFSVSEQTLNKWKKDYPEFLESLKKGKNIADANWCPRYFCCESDYKGNFSFVCLDKRTYRSTFP